eukprot:TRINITY_DN13193_c0_g2_i1.p1 TRINITY_DN13193_c0_g2~~TRINITY_DN13193_c0_g2_i1.p1  ORF type:complete len:423 (+),score=141.36 TRINITY_DN13193_c0_g2_i1:80-1270(+)
MGCCCKKPLQPHSYDVWEQSAAAGEQPRCVLILVNPYSGGKTGMKIFEGVKAILEKGGVEVRHRQTEYAGHAQQMAREEDLTGIDVLCSIGGDGTIHETVNGMMLRDRATVPDGLRVGVIPAGSGNTFAYDLGILTSEQAAECILSGKARPIDLLRLTTPPAGQLGPDAPQSLGAAAAEGALAEPLMHAPREGDVQYSLNMVGFGVPAAVLRRANSLRCCGGAQYNCAAYCELISNPSYPCRVHINGRYAGAGEDEVKKLKEQRLYAMIQAQLTVHMGEKVPLCSKAKLDDGMLDLLLIPYGSACALAGVMENAKKDKHTKGLGCDGQPTNVKYLQCEEVIWDPVPERTGPETVNVDGELCQSSPVKITCVPKALRVCCPGGAAQAGGAAAAPSAQ